MMKQAHINRLREYFRHGGRTFFNVRGDNVDLDLLTGGYIVTDQSKVPLEGFNAYKLTNKGVEFLQARRLEYQQRQSEHDEFAERVKKYLHGQGRLVWTNILFQIDVGYEVRPDVYSMVGTLNAEKQSPTIYEVKVSRSDFLSDMAKPEKREGYRRISEVVIYACPEGLIDKSEIPEEYGLLVETTPYNFKLIKRGRRKKVALSPSHWMNLVLKHKGGENG